MQNTKTPQEKRNTHEQNKNIWKEAFVKSIPITVQLPVCQYGIWNYDGRSRFSLVLFSAGQSVRVYRSLSVCACDAAFPAEHRFLTIALTAFLMNSRQSFYALTFVDEFAKMENGSFT